MQSSSDILRGTHSLVWDNAARGRPTNANTVKSHLMWGEDWAIRFISSTKLTMQNSGCHGQDLFGCGSGQTVSNCIPFKGLGDGFYYDQFRAGFVTLVKFGVDGTGEGFGVVRDYSDPAEVVLRGDVRVGDEVRVPYCVLRGGGEGGELVLQV